jgi:hypothetical protein
MAALCRALAAVLVAPLGFALFSPACYSLPKVDPGPHYIADFEEDAGLDGSAWSAFGGWSCRAYTTDQPGSDGGQEAAPDGGVVLGQAVSPDGGLPVSCILGSGTDDRANDQRALEAIFGLLAPNDGRQLAIEVETQTVVGTTVDFNSFSQFTFDVRLDSNSTSVKLPAGTQLKVQLGCATNLSERSVDQFPPNITLDATSWNTATPALSGFRGMDPSASPACLAVVDSVHFIVLFASAPPGSPIAGTLWLDNIGVQ